MTIKILAPILGIFLICLMCLQSANSRTISHRWDHEDGPCDLCKKKECVDDCTEILPGFYKSCTGRCNAYVQCDQYYRLYEMSCPNGMSFDMTLKTCLRNASCQVVVVTPVTSDTTRHTITTRNPASTDCQNTCEEFQNGFYHKCNTCREYLQCVNGQTYEQSCSYPLVWDNSITACNYHSRTCTEQEPSPEPTQGPSQVTTNAPAPSCPHTEYTYSCCVYYCSGLPDGDYQSCERCDGYVTCTNGRMSGLRECADPSLRWDDYAKQCLKTLSRTCFIDHIDGCANNNTNDCCAPPAGHCEDIIGGVRCSCNPGYSGNGKQCDEIDECNSNPCKNGGSCTDGINHYTCTCPPGYTGPECDEDINECEQDPCVNGECTHGIGYYTCECFPGYTGTNCEEEIDECNSNPCKNGGSCTDGINHYTCTCPPGYTGPECDEDVNECEQDPCVNGECTHGIGYYTCECFPGYTGTNCEEEIDECNSNPCENGGMCIDDINHYTCTCLAGYTGSNCEEDIDDCASNPCENGGSCNDQLNYYTCDCVDGYTGNECQTDMDDCASNPCENGGSCNDQLNYYTCDCVDGYTGNECQTNIDDCASNPCENGGSCNDQLNYYTCDCVDGYTGNECQTDMDDCASNPCENGGSCNDQLNYYTCDCVDGYTGNECQTNIDDCASNPCENGGSCNDQLNYYTCDCVDGYTGNECQTDMDDCASNPCENGGSCNDQLNYYTCDCVDGYTGNECQTDMDDCASNPCENGGSCNDQLNYYTCDCVDGYTGNECQTDIDDCASNPCENGGSCNDQLNYYTCDCVDGYTGNECQTVIDYCLPDNPCGPGDCTNDRNQNNGYTCNCFLGYFFDGTTCDDQDECVLFSPCPEFATCENIVGWYTCHCKEGYFGNGISCLAEGDCVEQHCSSLNFGNTSQQACPIPNFYGGQNDALYIEVKLDRSVSGGTCDGDNKFEVESVNTGDGVYQPVVYAKNACCADFRVCRCQQVKTITCNRIPGHYFDKCPINGANAISGVSLIQTPSLCKFNVNFQVQKNVLLIKDECEGTFSICIHEGQIPSP